jgi:threonine synthase
MTAMNYLTAIQIGDATRPANTLDFSGHQGSFPLARYDLAKIRNALSRDEIKRGPASIWRYWMLLPADSPAAAITMGEGYTPLIELRALGHKRLWLKDEGQNPSGSFKDRGASVGFTRYRELGVKALALNSTGNASAAWALYAARAGIRCTSFLPVDGQESTRKQCGLAGGEVHFVADWPNVGSLVARECAAHGWLNVSALREPYRIEGKKTLAFEIAEQFDWHLPNAIVFPTGGGQGVLALYKGFQELRELGWISDPDPQLVITQYAGCAPITRAFRENKETCEPWGTINILSGGMKSPNPVSGPAILALLRRTRGTAVAVTNEEALAAEKEMCRSEGLFICPEVATTLVGVRKAVESGVVAEHDSVVLIGTATGLKSLSHVADPMV